MPKATSLPDVDTFLLLFVPTRFTAEAETDLQDPLKALGITDMFDQSKANFAKITSKFCSVGFGVL